MARRCCRIWLAALGVAMLGVLSACQSFGREEAFGYSMGGIDHLANNLSVTDFWVNGAAGFQAGSGNAGVPAPVLPAKWHPGTTVHVVWDVRDWERDKWSTHEADVPVDPYTEDGGDLWVHFLANGTVRAVVSNMGPRSPTYPGPHDPIPHKNPWDMYPPRIDWRTWNERLLDDRVIRQRCSHESDPKGCENRTEQKLLDEQRADARRYLPRCATINAGYVYDECETQARQSMAAARLARRCQLAPDLAECSAHKAERDAPKPTPTAGTDR